MYVTLIAMHCNTSEFGLNNTVWGVSEYTTFNVYRTKQPTMKKKHCINLSVQLISEMLRSSDFISVTKYSFTITIETISSVWKGKWFFIILVIKSKHISLDCAYSFSRTQVYIVSGHVFTQTSCDIYKDQWQWTLSSWKWTSVYAALSRRSRVSNCGIALLIVEA